VESSNPRLTLSELVEPRGVPGEDAFVGVGESCPELGEEEEEVEVDDEDDDVVVVDDETPLEDDGAEVRFADELLFASVLET
jgi:hypothetical protein